MYIDHGFATYMSTDLPRTCPWICHVHVHRFATYMSMDLPRTCPQICHVHVHGFATYMSTDLPCTCPWNFHVHVHGISTYIRFQYSKMSMDLPRTLSIEFPRTGPWNFHVHTVPILHTFHVRKIHGNSMDSMANLHPGTKTDIDKNIKEFKEGKFDKIPDPTHLEHFRKTEKPASTQQTSSIKVNTEDETPPMGTHTLPHPIWSEEELHNVQITHNPPEKFVDKLAYFSVKVMRKSFDILTRFNWGERDEKKWVLRICFLETVAGVPGMVAAMTRHLHSLRRLQRDYGWIHTLLEEAENERMHLMTALQLRQPSWLFRTCVIGAQGAFVTMFSISYLLSPRFCHRFVGYLEEEAVITYSKCLKDIDHGPLRHWKTQPAPEVALRYWKLAPDATMKDVILAIRADEAHHRVVNHTLASMNEKQYNPYKPGK